jgi:hypothetical protein
MNNLLQSTPQTTPNWQMELLVSGGAVVAIWQLLAILDERMATALSPLRMISEITPILYLYPYAALLAIGVAFAVHLAMRSLWIAIVGVQSVFPEGIQWQNFKASNRTTDRLRDWVDSPEVIAEKIDNSSTVVYAFGIVVAAMQIGLSVFMCLGFGLVSILRWRWLSHWSDMEVLVAMLFPLFGLVIMVQALDHVPAKWLPPQSARARAVQWVVRNNFRLTHPKPTSYLMCILITGFGRWLGTVALFVLMTAAVIAASTRMLAQRGLFDDNTVLINQISSTNSYADQRDASAMDVTPFIDSLHADGPFVRLNIPYRFRHFRDLAASQVKLNVLPTQNKCTVQPNAVVDAKLLDCVRLALTIELDAKPVECELEFVHIAANDTHAMRCMIDARLLRAGKHTLSVHIPPRRAKSKPEVHVIPFWR